MVTIFDGGTAFGLCLSSPESRESYSCDPRCRRTAPETTRTDWAKWEGARAVLDRRRWVLNASISTARVRSDTRPEAPRRGTPGFCTFALWVLLFVRMLTTPICTVLVCYMSLADYFAARTEHAPRICALRRR